MSSSLWNFFFYWTISGSVFYLFNFLLHPLEKRLLPPIMRNWLLRVNVFIFLIPMPRYVYRFKNLYSEILKVEFPPKLSFHITVGSYITVPFRDEYILLPEEGRIILIAFLLWSACAVAHIVRYTILYRRFKKVILHNPRNHPLSASSADYQLIADICRRLKLRKNPIYLWFKTCKPHLPADFLNAGFIFHLSGKFLLSFTRLCCTMSWRI